MDFKQQYQTEMQHISPSEEQCERIRAKVYEEIQKPQNVQMPQMVQKHKKPLSLKAIAITGASAACLVLVTTFALRFAILSKESVNTAGGAAPAEMYQESETARANDMYDIANYGTISSNVAIVTHDTATSESKSTLLPGATENKSSEHIGADTVQVVLKIVFSEDMAMCEIYKGDEYKKYALSNNAPLKTKNESLLEEIPAIYSSLNKTLFIYFKDNVMWVYNENKEFIGAFAEIS